MSTDIFGALREEAKFTKEMLGAGTTQIRHANYASKKGVYFQAFTSLSTGIERIGKLCLILDHFINHEGKFPNDKDMRAVGHDIEDIYIKSQSVIVANSIKLKYLSDLDTPIHQAILKLLSKFATGDRYSNINFIVKATQSDPIASWFKEVDTLIYETCIPEKKRNKIREDAAISQEIYGDTLYVEHTSESNELIDNLEKAVHQTGVFETVSPYRQFYVLQIIRYWVELLVALQDKAMSTDPHGYIPYFSEIFQYFNCRDNLLKNKKKWDNLP